MDNKKRNVMIMGIFILILSGIGFTYAIWNAYFVQKDPNTLATTCFKISFEEDEDFDAITLQKAHPITEEEGLKLNPYKFTVTNNCQDYASYEIHLEIDSESTLTNYDAIHISLNDESFVLGDKQVVTKTLNSATTAFNLTKGYLNKEESKDFELRMWIDENADTTVVGQQFLSQITLTATYAKEIPKTLEETILSVNLETDDSGASGLYKVTHNDASITYTSDPTSIANLQKDEYRYAGSNPNNYVDVGDKYTTDTYGFFTQDKYDFYSKEKCESDRNESLKYYSDSDEVTECSSTTNTEGLYFLEYKDSEGDDYSYTEIFEDFETCQSAQTEYESYESYIVQECTSPENIYSYTATYQEDFTEYSSNDECKSENDGYEGICKVTHSAGDPVYWRIIGLVNTPEGQKIKLIRDNIIGYYSWDTSTSNVNNGYGVNEWSQSDLMKLLNEGYEENQLEDSEGVTQDTYVNNSLYWNGGKGQCYDSSSNSASPCDFANHKMPDSLKDMIEEVTWNTGSNGEEYSYSNIKVKEFYNLERSSNTGKICDSSNSWCNDEVKRETSWQGKVGLIYPSDYGYATSGGNETNRTSCLGQTEDNIVVYDWDSYVDCYDNDWLLPISWDWTFSPRAASDNAYNVLDVNYDGYVDRTHANSAGGVRPSVYLKSNIFVKQGNGSKENPFVLEG